MDDRSDTSSSTADYSSQAAYQQGSPLAGGTTTAGGSSGAPMGGGAGTAPGFSSSNTDALSVSPIPGLSFPATKDDIQQQLSTLPQDQQSYWTNILPQLADGQIYTSAEQLQEMIQTLQVERTAA